MAVELDPMVRRGLKKASEGDPEIAEICSLNYDVSVNEEPHLQVPVMELVLRRGGTLSSVGRGRSLG